MKITTTNIFVFTYSNHDRLLRQKDHSGPLVSTVRHRTYDEHIYLGERRKSRKEVRGRIPITPRVGDEDESRWNEKGLCL